MKGGKKRERKKETVMGIHFYNGESAFDGCFSNCSFSGISKEC